MKEKFSTVQITVLFLFNQLIRICSIHNSNVFPSVDKQALNDSCAMCRSLCGGSATLWNISIPDLKLLIASLTFSAWNGKMINDF